MPAQTQPGKPSEYLGLKLGQDFLDGAREFERSWLYSCRQRGIWRLWWLIYCQLHGIDSNTGNYNSNSELQFMGDQQRYAIFRVQLARRYIKQREMMAKDQRPKFTGVAENNDVRSLVEVNIATRAIENLLAKAKLEQKASKALSSLCNYGMGALMVGWDFAAGEEVPAMEPELDQNGQVALMPKLDVQGNPVVSQDPRTGEPVQDTEPVMREVQKPSGAPTIRRLFPWQAACDVYMEDEHSQVVVKIPVNKYELAAQFKEKYDQIVALSIDDEMGDDALFAWGGARAVSSDTVILRMYFHKNCDAVKGGRWAGYVKGVGLWGVDEAMPCPLKNGIPVKFMMGPQYDGTAFGYPESGDLLSLQQVINELVSMGVTNAQKRGNANAYKRDDIQIDQQSWSDGGKLIDLPAGAEKPEWDEPPQMDSLTQYMLEFCLEQARLMLGSNSVTEGNPEANISSGSFAVLLVNVAQKYASESQEAYDNAITEIANDALELTRLNAENGFWAEIAGIGDSPYAQIISKDQLTSLRRVHLVRQSPVLSTFVGRAEVFDRLSKLPKPDRADAAEMLLTGDMESFAGRDQAFKIRVRKENEWLLQGINPVVTAWDDHALEGREHRMQYDKLRTMDPPSEKAAYYAWAAACKAHEDHLIAHANALAEVSPPIALVAGWAPIQIGAPAGGPGDQEPQPEQPEGSPGGGKPKPNGGAAGGGGPKPPKPPKMPEPPKGAGGVASNP